MLRSREALTIEQVDDGGTRLGRLEVLPPAHARVVGKRLGVRIGCDRRREHRREQAVLVSIPGGAVCGEVMNDAGPAAPSATLRGRGDETVVGQDPQVPADGVGMQPHERRKVAGVEPVRRLPEGL